MEISVEVAENISINRVIYTIHDDIIVDVMSCIVKYNGSHSHSI